MTVARPFELPSPLASAVEAAVAWRDMTVDAYLRKGVETATRLGAELATALKDGEDDLAAGRFYTQEQVEAMFNVRREQRRTA